MNIQKMLKQAQKMQEELAKKQDQLASQTVEVSVANGRVTVVANGAGDVLSIKISKEIVDPEDIAMLEDLVLSGVTKAIHEGKELAQKEMQKVTSGLGLPSGLGGLGLGL